MVTWRSCLAPLLCRAAWSAAAHLPQNQPLQKQGWKEQIEQNEAWIKCMICLGPYRSTLIQQLPVIKELPQFPCMPSKTGVWTWIVYISCIVQSAAHPQYGSRSCNWSSVSTFQSRFTQTHWVLLQHTFLTFPFHQSKCACIDKWKHTSTYCVSKLWSCELYIFLLSHSVFIVVNWDK